MLDQIADAIRAAESGGRVVEVKGLEGLSGDRLIGALQRFAMLGGRDRCYVEVGVYRGLTLVSVAKAASGTPVFGIDNFTQFDPDKTNRNFVMARLAESSLRQVELIDNDFEIALPRLGEQLNGRRVGTYFVDGPHDYRSQLMCLELMRPFLAEFAVVVVDDSNYLHVRQANRDFLTIHPDYKLLFEAYTPCHPENMDGDAQAEARRGWWNGVNVLVHDPNDVLEAALPPVDPERAFFLNDHIVHASRLAGCADLAVDMAAKLASFRLVSAARALLRVARWKPRPGGAFRPDYPARNTYSAELPAHRLNSRLASHV